MAMVSVELSRVWKIHSADRDGGKVEVNDSTSIPAPYSVQCFSSFREVIYIVVR